MLGGIRSATARSRRFGVRMSRTIAFAALFCFLVGVVPVEVLALETDGAQGVELPVSFPEPMPRPKSASAKIPLPVVPPAAAASPSTPVPTAAPSPDLAEVSEELSGEPSLDPDAVEVASLRTRDSKTFRNPDGSLTAVVGGYLHYQDEDEVWQDVDLNFHADGAEFVMDRHDLEVRVSALGIRATERASGKGVFWPTLGAPVVEGRSATFEGPLGLEWSYFTRKSGIKLVATVPASLGLRTLSFPFTLVGGAAAFTVQDGALVSDVFTVPAPFAVGAADAGLVDADGGTNIRTRLQ